jgi:hypothetical protein
MAYQPEPISTMVANLRGVTAITRVWEAGDCKFCRLCPACSATEEGVCTVLTTRKVTDEAAELFSVV